MTSHPVAASADDATARTELLTPEPAEALAGLLDLPSPAFDHTLPPLWHWVYLLDRPRQDDLGVDGHPTNGIPAPPRPDQRRMYAGGRLTMRQPLRLGEPATRSTEVISTAEKLGKSGPLTFVTVRHSFDQHGTTAIIDERDIVYRPQGPALPARDDSNDAAPDVTRAPAAESLALEVDPVLLFRFSALTYNAHRIHYDLDYARTEGYPDLVIHGPLQVLLMAELLRRLDVSMIGRTFAYRLVAPAFGSQRITATLDRGHDTITTEVTDATGRATATGTLLLPTV